MLCRQPGGQHASLDDASSDLTGTALQTESEVRQAYWSRFLPLSLVGPSSAHLRLEDACLFSFLQVSMEKGKLSPGHSFIFLLAIVSVVLKSSGDRSVFKSGLSHSQAV